MKAKPVSPKKPKSSKQDREREVLLGLIDYYIRTGKPVGSNTLKTNDFDNLSSATIRNYFAHLETEGYLHQQHSSGGRIPAPSAWRIYCQEFFDSQELSPEQEVEIDKLAKTDKKEIAYFLQETAESLSKLANTAVFISAPRFDHDYIIDIKIVPIDANRALSILISDFGVIHTETLTLDQKISSHAAHRIENYFRMRLTGEAITTKLDKEEELLAKGFYNELMLRYIVRYANFTDPDIYRTGFSKLLNYQEFQDTSILATSLSLFENVHGMRLLLRDSMAKKNMQVWIGDDLIPYSNEIPNCTIITHPYYINNQSAGALGILGPMRMEYKKLFAILRAYSDCITKTLTKTVYKHKISFRQPQPKMLESLQKEHKLLSHKTL